MMSIRKATLQDLAKIHDIESLCFPKGSYPLFVIRQLFDISQDYFLIAQEDHKILGYVIGNHTKENDQGWVLSLGVHPEARGKKVGTTLINQLVKLLEESQSREICLTVHPNDAAAVRLYKTAGFEVSATHDNYYLDNEPRLLMIKQTVYDLINS